MNRAEPTSDLNCLSVVANRASTIDGAKLHADGLVGQGRPGGLAIATVDEPK